ncbi:VOC family protein [Arenibacter latericius]|uniref:VOC family protein n=1 Tax=Arenibacter latericius TaxID=86104 RepID=UPI000403DA4D|nr:VOC family protein [Arenibacter latericius]MDX1364305.1 VOC family protein [Arenibacter latericius]
MDILKVKGVLETSLYVSNLQVAMDFYKTIFKMDTLIENRNFCALNVTNKQVLLLFQKGSASQGSSGTGGIIPPHDGFGNLHLAFSISEADLIPWKEWLTENKVEIESEYKWERGGTSLYFRDADNHLLELATPGLWTIY